jgi:spore coat polysaccharide biosynthesis protein SpsF
MAVEQGVEVFAGSEDDVLDRYYRAATKYKADIVGRLPADNPVPEPTEIDRIAQHHRELDRPGFSSNLAQVFHNGYPDGIGAEMVDFSLLEEAHRTHKDLRHREHVHLNFFDYATQQPLDAVWCPVSTVQCPPEFARPDIILDVNTKQQYDFMASLYDALYPRNQKFSIIDIINWLDGKSAHSRKTF